jgi:hypothetical protein
MRLEKRHSQSHPNECVRTIPDDLGILLTVWQACTNRAPPACAWPIALKITPLKGQFED